VGLFAERRRTTSRTSEKTPLSRTKSITVSFIAIWNLRVSHIMIILAQIKAFFNIKAKNKADSLHFYRSTAWL
jgi:hypothetical protein